MWVTTYRASDRTSVSVGPVTSMFALLVVCGWFVIVAGAWLFLFGCVLAAAPVWGPLLWWRHRRRLQREGR